MEGFKVGRTCWFVNPLNLKTSQARIVHIASMDNMFYLVLEKDGNYFLGYPTFRHSNILLDVVVFEKLYSADSVEELCSIYGNLEILTEAKPQRK